MQLVEDNRVVQLIPVEEQQDPNPRRLRRRLGEGYVAWKLAEQERMQYHLDVFALYIYIPAAKGMLQDAYSAISPYILADEQIFCDLIAADCVRFLLRVLE